tara:strand:+ start:224 stop:661 length:438 start_codon:yes stop_codon:yes gene_type:complete
MTKRKWGEWKKVDLTTYPFNLKDETWSQEVLTDKEDQIIMGLFSVEFEGKDLEFFDSETASPPPIPDELKIYCPEKEWDTEFWPTAIGNTEEHPYDWEKWFYIDFYTPYTHVTGWKNRSFNGNWYMIVWEALLPVFIRPVKEKKE